MCGRTAGAGKGRIHVENLQDLGVSKFRVLRLCYVGLVLGKKHDVAHIAIGADNILLASYVVRSEIEMDDGMFVCKIVFDDDIVGSDWA